MHLIVHVKYTKRLFAHYLIDMLTRTVQQARWQLINNAYTFCDVDGDSYSSQAYTKMQLYFFWCHSNMTISTLIDCERQLPEFWPQKSIKTKNKGLVDAMQHIALWPVTHTSFL